jgi:hypothetical protein
MNEAKTIQNIEILADKAAKTEKSEDALRFSQAACNLANAFGAFIDAQPVKL